MKKIIQVVSLIVAGLSLIFILYGSIKLARVEAATVSPDIESGIPGVEIVQPSNVITREDAQIIVGISVATLVLGIVGYFISSRMEFRETVPSIGKSQNTLRHNNAHSLLSEVASVASTSSRSQEIEFKLSDHQWQHRIVLIFAPSERSPAYQQQIQAWQADEVGVRDRDLKLVEVLGTGESRVDGQFMTSASAESLRRQFGVTVEEFVVILVGKDGTEKQRSGTPVTLAMLFRTIDAMPMRQQEMRSQQ